jgi:hypothetical protein
LDREDILERLPQNGVMTMSLAVLRIPREYDHTIVKRALVKHSQYRLVPTQAKPPEIAHHDNRRIVFACLLDQALKLLLSLGRRQPFIRQVDLARCIAGDKTDGVA